MGRMRRFIILALCMELLDEEWVALKTVSAAATTYVEGIKGKQLPYPTLRSAKATAIAEGLLEQRKVGRSYELHVTEAGREYVANFNHDAEENSDEGLSQGVRFVRVGGEHRLPKGEFLASVRAVNRGEAHMVFVPAGATVVAYKIKGVDGAVRVGFCDE